jgi:TonB-dependent starch-binding outer membrane protein SusC
MRRKQFFKKQIRKLIKYVLLLLLSSLIAPVLIGQERSITGTVTDQEGITLPGVNVIVKGTSNGTVTDLNGRFAIKVPNSNSVLLISYIGYQSQDLALSDMTDYPVRLSESVKELNEVVVVGYGVQKRSDLTGAIASVSGEKLSEIPIAGIDQALQGRAAGVNIIPKTGRPGSGVDIQIRGITSINGTSPLVIIDGVASGNSDDGALTKLNPNDIESIEVLKDASSAAIYGASGGNGVILVTTKKGKEGKIVTSFNTYRGYETVISKIDLMNSQQWMELFEETNPHKVNGVPTPYTYRPDTFKTYDWQDMMFRKALTENYDLSFSGGSERSKFLVSSSYNKQSGILKNSDNERFTLRINSEYNITKRITFDEKISYVNTVNSGFEDWEWQNYYSNPVKNILNMQPYLPVYNPDYKSAWGDSSRWSIGEYGGGTNPQVALDMKNRKKRNNDFEGNFGLNLEIIKGLVFTTRFDGMLGFFDDKEFKAEYFASATDANSQSELDQAMRRNISWDFQNILTYNFNLFEAHSFTLVAGSEARRNYWYDLSGLRVDMPSNEPNMLYLRQSTNSTLEKQIVTGSGDEERSYRYIGRLNYDYKSKYLLTINASTDVPSNIGPSNRNKTFPSFSVGWKFSEEEFMKNQSLISFGKLRLGWGKTGANAMTGTPYASMIYTPLTYKYAFDNKASLVGAGPVQIPNPDIKWESVNMTNIGLDLGMFKNSLYFTIEYFEKINDGMIMLQELPATNGTATMGKQYDLADTKPYVNVGSVRNRGLEFSVNVKKQEGDLKGSFDLNLGVVRNKVLDLASDSIIRGGVHNVSQISLTREGGSISEFYGFISDGLYRDTDPQRVLSNGKVVFLNQPYYLKSNASGGTDTVFSNTAARAGDVRYVDLNEDGKIDQKDKTSIGSPLPKFTLGFSFNLEYKLFDLSANFYCSYGNKIFNGTKQYLYYSQDNGNRAAAFANRYKEEVIKDGLVVVKENKNTDLPRFGADNYVKPSKFYIEDGSYLRLQNLQIGISLPKSICEKVKISKFRIYAGAKNLFTLTNYEGYSPDVSSGQDGVKGLSLGVDNGTYPCTRMFLAGINLQF